MHGADVDQRVGHQRVPLTVQVAGNSQAAVEHRIGVRIVAGVEVIVPQLGGRGGDVRRPRIDGGMQRECFLHHGDRIGVRRAILQDTTECSGRDGDVAMAIRTYFATERQPFAHQLLGFGQSRLVGTQQSERHQ